MIFFSQFPEETKKATSACGGNRASIGHLHVKYSILTHTNVLALDDSPKAIEFGHSHPENGKNNPNYPVNPV